MGKRDDLIAKYADDIRKLGMTPDMDLLTKVTVACGPSIYREDASTVAASDPAELDRIKTNFCAKKLGVTDPDRADAAIQSAIDAYGRGNRNKQRAVLYYLLAKDLGGI